MAGSGVAGARRSRLTTFLYPEYVFLTLAVLFGLVFVSIIPPMAGWDENTHAFRVDQLAHLKIYPEQIIEADELESGEIRTPEERILYGGWVNEGLYQFTLDNLAKVLDPNSTFELPLSSFESGYQFEPGESHAVVFSNTVVNSPIAYAPQVIGYVLARLFTSSVYWPYFFARLFGFAFFAFAGFWSIRKAPFGKWVVAAFCFIPDVFLSMTVITADVMAISVSLLFITSVLALACKPDNARVRPSEWALLALWAALLGGVKATYIALLFLLLAPVVACKAFRKPRAFMGLVGVCALGLAVFAFWYSTGVHSINTGAMWGGRELVSPSAQAAYLLSHPGEFLAAVLYRIDGSNLFLVENGTFVLAYRISVFACPIQPWFIAAIWLVSLLVRDPRELELTSLAPRKPVLAVLLGAAAALCFILVCAALYVSYTPVGFPEIEGVQCRYLAPVALMLLLAVVALLDWVGARILGKRGLSTVDVTSISTADAPTSRAARAPSATLSRLAMANTVLRVVLAGAFVVLLVLCVVHVAGSYY